MRLLSIDILRTLAIFMMVLVHFVENLASGYGLSATTVIGPYHRWWLPTGLAAPLFTFLSGVSYQTWLTVQQQRGLTDEAISKQTIRRGLFLIGLGFAFNVFVWLPEDTFNWDILTFIGSALIVLDLIRRMPAEVPPVLLLLVTMLSPALQVLADYPAYWVNAYFDYDVTLSDVLLGYLVVGYFPLFPWLIFPVAGFVLAPAVLSEAAATDQPRPSVNRWFLLVGLLAAGSLLLQWAAGDVAGLGRWTMFPASTSYLLGMLAVAIASLLTLHWLVDRPAQQLADCGNSLPPQDAATGNPENCRRFRWLPRWKKAVEDFFHGQLAAGWLAHCCRVMSRHSLSLYLLHHVVHIWPLWLYGLATTGDPTVHWRTLLPVPLAGTLAVIFCLACVPLFLQIDRRGWPTVEGLMRWLA